MDFDPETAVGIDDDAEPASCDSDTEDYLLDFQRIGAKNAHQDISADPKLPVSDHGSDDEPSGTGYNDYDSDEGVEQSQSETQNFVTRLDKDVLTWCTCGDCKTMESELECYCCQESTIISDFLLSGKDVACVTELPILKKTVEEKDVLELQGSGLRAVSRDNEGMIKPEGYRFIAYTTFLQMCTLRFCGKGRRYVVPSCVVSRIRDLYPSPNGKYTDFVPGEIDSRI